MSPREGKIIQQIEHLERKGRSLAGISKKDITAISAFALFCLGLGFVISFYSVPSNHPDTSPSAAPPAPPTVDKDYDNPLFLSNPPSTATSPSGMDFPNLDRLTRNLQLFCQQVGSGSPEVTYNNLKKHHKVDLNKAIWVYISGKKGEPVGDPKTIISVDPTDELCAQKK